MTQPQRAPDSPPPRRRKSAFTCARLMEVALQVVADEGLHAATYARIAGDAGVRSRGVIYYHYEDRTAFLRALHAHIMRRRSDRLAALVQGSIGRRSPAVLIDLYWGLLHEPPFRAYAALEKAARFDQEVAAILAEDPPLRGLLTVNAGLSSHEDRILLVIVACVADGLLGPPARTGSQPNEMAVLDYLKRIAAAAAPAFVTAA